MSSSRWAITPKKLGAAIVLAFAATGAHAGMLRCLDGTAADCEAATSTLSWQWDGVDFTVYNAGTGYVSEVYFDLLDGMDAQYIGGTGTVQFQIGAHPSQLPGGNEFGFQADVSYDADGGLLKNSGIDQGESAIFRISNALLDSFDTGSLIAGLHVRSVVTGGASVVTMPANRVPEPATLGMALTALTAVAWTRRRSRKA